PPPAIGTPSASNSPIPIESVTRPVAMSNQSSAAPANGATPHKVPQPPRTLAIANQKGGVGKPPPAINLGTALAAVGETVLIVDLDPQGNASTGLGIDRASRRHSTYDVLVGETPLRSAVLKTAVPHLSIAPSTLDLSGFELEVGHARDRAFRLRRALSVLAVPAADETHF